MYDRKKKQFRKNNIYILHLLALRLAFQLEDGLSYHYYTISYATIVPGKRNNLNSLKSN